MQLHTSYFRGSLKSAIRWFNSFVVYTQVMRFCVGCEPGSSTAVSEPSNHMGKLLSVYITLLSD